MMRSFKISVCLLVMIFAISSFAWAEEKEEAKTIVAQKEKTEETTPKKEGAEEKEEVKRQLEIEEMVVTATKTPINVKEVPASVNVVTWEDIKLTPQPFTYHDALRKVPGLIYLKDGFTPRLSIRGEERPPVLLNGREITLFHGGYSFHGNLMGMGAIERIEVIRGPQSAVHGSKAVSGVINIITKKGDKENPYVEMNGLYGTGEELHGGLSLSGGYDKLSYYINASGESQEEYETPKGTIPFTEYDRQNIYSRFDYAFSDKHKIALEYTFNEGHSLGGGEGTYHEIKKSWLKTGEGKNKFNAGFLSYNGDFTDWFSLYADVGVGKYDMGSTNADIDKPLEFLSKAHGQDVSEDMYWGEIRGTFNILPEDRLRATAGMQYRKSEMDFMTWANFKTGLDITEEEKYTAPYLQVEYRPIPYALLAGGIRYDSYKYKKGSDTEETSPKIGLSIFPFANTDHDWTTLWASYSEGFRAPRGFQLYHPYVGNPDLKPEKSEGWEIGIKQRVIPWANVELSYFEADYTDRILMHTGTWQFENTGKSTLEGYELLLEVYPTYWLTLHFAYTDLDGTDEITGKEIVGQPNQIFNYGLTIEDLYGFYGSVWGYQKSDWMYNYTTEHPAEGKVLWDAKLSYRWHINDKILFEPFVSVENLSDEEYYDGPYVHIREGRTLHVGTSLRINF